METLTELFQIFLNLDEVLRDLVPQYGLWVYLILFAIIFAETGLVVTPFLPGDSLLFAAGALAGDAILDIGILIPSLILAAIIGDSVNYYVGSRLGRSLVDRYSKVIKPRHVARTEAFYLKHGGKTIVIARFLPIIRTFAPFVAGISRMPYGRFMAFNVSGGVLWVVSMTGIGFLFGNLPWVQHNFEAVIIGIVIISVMPAVIEAVRAGRHADEPAEPA